MKSSSNFNGWKITQLGNICDISSSKRIFASEYKTSGIPFYRGKEIIEKFNKKPISTELFISPERFNEINNKFGVPKEGDILLTSVGTLGIPYLVGNEDFYFKDGNLTWFKQFKSCNSRFLFFWFQSPFAKHQIETKSIGSTQKALTIDILKNFTIHLPPIKVQNKIVAILSSIDDKIELNNKINRNLEAQAQAIFKSWFIDFEPFKNGKFIDSELGKIPEGWKVESIYSISEVIYGAPFSSNLFNNKQLGTPIIRIRDLPNEASNTYTTESHPKGYLIKQGDIVVGMDGEFKAYLWGGDNAWLNQRICVFKSKLNVSTAFVMFSIVPLLNEVESSELATTVIHLGKNDIDRFKIILPKLNILKEFNRISIPIFDAIIKNKRESQRLAQLRDTLLPKLMSGETLVS